MKDIPQVKCFRWKFLIPVHQSVFGTEPGSLGIVAGSLYSCMVLTGGGVTDPDDVFWCGPDGFVYEGAHSGTIDEVL